MIFLLLIFFINVIIVIIFIMSIIIIMILFMTGNYDYFIIFIITVITFIILIIIIIIFYITLHKWAMSKCIEYYCNHYYHYYHGQKLWSWTILWSLCFPTSLTQLLSRVMVKMTVRSRQLSDDLSRHFLQHLQRLVMTSWPLPGRLRPPIVARATQPKSSLMQLKFPGTWIGARVFLSFPFFGNMQVLGKASAALGTQAGRRCFLPYIRFLIAEPLSCSCL